MKTEGEQTGIKFSKEDRLSKQEDVNTTVSRNKSVSGLYEHTTNT